MKERIRVRLGAETVLVFGPESVSYERSRRENRTILREISVRVFFVKIQKHHEKSYFQSFQDIRKFQETCSKNNPRQHNTTPGAARPPPVFPGYQAIRKTRSPIFPGDQEIRKNKFPIFPGDQKIRKIQFPIFPGYEKIMKIKFPSISRIRNN